LLKISFRPKHKRIHSFTKHEVGLTDHPFGSDIRNIVKIVLLPGYQEVKEKGREQFRTKNGILHRSEEKNVKKQEN
jgi:hypothetical protein